MSDLAETFNSWKSYQRAIRSEAGVECPECKRLRPKTNASILLPQQRCKVDGYRDSRQRLTEEQIKDICKKHKAPFWERTK